MLLHFDFEPQVPTWREFQQALEAIAGQKASMTGGPSGGGGPPRWTAKLSGLAGQLVLDYQHEVEGGVVVHAIEAHRSFVAPLMDAFGGIRRSPRLEARIDRDTLDYSNGPNLYSPEWYELTTAEASFKLDAGFLCLLFDEDPQGPIGQLLELEAGADDSVVLSRWCCRRYKRSYAWQEMMRVRPVTSTYCRISTAAARICALGSKHASKQRER